MEQQKKSNGAVAAPKKELTPAQIQRRKKMLVMPLFFLIFLGAMWLIFAPGAKTEEQKDGLNAELPMPKDESIVSDKRDAYQREAMREKEEEKMRSLQDFSAMFEQAQQSDEEYERQLRMAPKPPEYYEDPSRFESSRGSSHRAIESSATAYQDINRQLGSWYEQPAEVVAEPEQSAFEARIIELESRLGEEALRKRTQDEQLEMLEKSYQMAAKYMPQSAQSATPAAFETAPATTANGKTIAQPVKQVRSNVVSLLAAPATNDEFMADYMKPRNLGFLTAAGNEDITDKNCIRACVYQTVTLTNGKELQIRLLEPMRAGSMLIPANTVITGACRITGERMDVTINSIQYADNIVPVELLVYDTDGQKGIFVPGNDEINAIKEVASSLSNSAGTSIMISDNAGSQLAADAGKGLIQGASQYVSKKMSVVKITLKANYRLLLLPKNN